ncbi:MAG TPA: hypothetical protein VIJ27_12535 [Mucilaginibacter sp.]
MENKDWLNDYKLLKQVSDANPFTVPAGYFDNLEERIVSGKNLEELKNNGLTGGFTVPGNYFEELTANIQSRLTIEEVVNKKDAKHFTVPQGYFNQLNKSIVDKTVNSRNASGNGMVIRLFASAAFKYATAACFALVLGGGILLNELTDPAYIHKNSFLHKQLSNVPIDDIKNYLQLNVDAGDTQQTVLTEGSPVDDTNLKNALQNYVDSVQ